MSLIDRALLDELADLLGPQLAPILATFRTQVEAYQHEITRAAAAREFDALRRAAHGLKGASASVGATALHDAMQTLEHAATLGDVASVDATIGTLPGLARDTLAALSPSERG